MPKKIQTSEATHAKVRPALTPEARENQLIALAVDEAEYQIRNHTASSGVIVHFLKLATQRERKELEKLEKENKLLEAKTDAIQSAKDVTELYSEAIKAMKSYAGASDSDEEFEY